LKTRKSDFLTEARTCRESRVIQTHRIFPFDLNPFGYLFGGKLMTLIDDAASIAISRHCRRGAVTASLDNLNFLKPLHDNHSVFVKVIGEDLATGERYLAATCFTTFVAVPSHMNEEKQFTVPHVVPETEEEKMVCGGYEKRRNHRLKERTEYQNFAALLSTDLPWSDEGTGD
jgi:acyl-CoA hydrolase